MLTNKQLMEYYNNHKENYPVVFSRMDDGIIMVKAEGENSIAYLENNGYEVYPSDEMPMVYINSLKEDAERHHLEFDENNPQSVLDTFVDCTYLKLNSIKHEIEELMRIIEGRG